MFATDPPIKYDCSDLSNVSLTVRVLDEANASVSIAKQGAELVTLGCSVATARLVACAVLGGGEELKVISSGTSKGVPVVIWLTGATLFVFEKRLKKTISLKSLLLDAQEADDGMQHLVCTEQGNNEILRLAVPEPLLLVSLFFCFCFVFVLEIKGNN